MNKRNDYLTWNEYFMALAVLSSYRSKDPSTQVGACIINPKNNRVLSLGYNGFPNGCSDDVFPWGKTNRKEEDNKYSYVVHAELNAILNAKQDLVGSTLYVTHFPCAECAKAIVQSGIKEVVYLHDYPHGNIATGRMFKAAHVEVHRYSGKEFMIDISLK